MMRPKDQAAIFGLEPTHVGSSEQLIVDRSVMKPEKRDRVSLFFYFSFFEYEIVVQI